MCGIVLNISAQQKQFNLADDASLMRLKHDVCLLASDSLMGREAGTAGEYLSRMFIASQFTEAGLQPFFGDTSFFRSFTYHDEPFIANGTTFSINGKNLKLLADFYPLAYSINDTVIGETFNAGYGISAAFSGYDDYKDTAAGRGKIFVMELGAPAGYEENEAIQQRAGKYNKILLAQERGAIAVIFICSDTAYGRPSDNPNYYWQRASIPVLYVTKNSLFSKTGNDKISLAVNIDRESKRSAYNVAGWINNHAEYSIVIGGHYDHLGTGQFGARNGGGEDNIFYGADDNASGTAGVMELARRIKTSGLTKYNYIFVAFSAEEKGLIGSSRFLSDSSINGASVNCMIDLDMIGRLNEKNEVKIFGVGTAKEWKNTIKNIPAEKLKLVNIKSGAGGSDHMPFYYHNIPDIFIHTGLHTDYHTPKDICEKVNFEGMIRVINFTQKLIESLDSKPKLTFKTVSAGRMVFDLVHFL
jgi:hypothetical protein